MTEPRMSWIYRFTDWLREVLGVRPERVRPVLMLVYGCGTEDKPDFANFQLVLGDKPEARRSLYMNGVLFFRIMLPFFIGGSIRWTAKEAPTPKWMHRWRKIWPQFCQAHVGWKLNGHSAITLRFQSDGSAFVSNTGDAGRNNHGQAIGWRCGTK